MANEDSVRAGSTRRRVWKPARFPATPLIVAGILVAWESITRIRHTPNYILPRPTRIAEAGWTSRSDLLHQLSHTLVEACAGFALATAVAIALAIAVQNSRIFELSILPWLIVFQAVPVVAITPILAVIIGRNTFTIVVIVTIVAFFAVMVNTLRGLRSVADESLELMHVIGASWWSAYRFLRLPAALPYVFTGLRIAASVAIPAAMIAEWMSADKGLGFYLIYQTALYKSEVVWAGIVVATVAGVILFGIVGIVERVVVPWNTHERSVGH